MTPKLFYGIARFERNDKKIQEDTNKEVSGGRVKKRNTRHKPEVNGGTNKKETNLKQILEKHEENT